MIRNNIYYLYPTHEASSDDREMFPEFYRSQISPTSISVTLPIVNEAANVDATPIKQKEE